MACVNPDGSLSPTGRQLLEALGPSDAPAGLTAPELAAAVGVPLFRVRSSVRDAAAAGLVIDDEAGIRRTAEADRLLTPALAARP
jgi:hypothetical protein